MSQYGQSPQQDPNQPGGYAHPSSYGTPTGFPSQGQGAPSYGAFEPQPGYGVAPAQGYGYGYGGGPVGEHPQATTVLVLGIVGVFAPVLSFVAWYMGGTSKKEIEAGAPYAWDGGLKVGYWLGKVLSIIQLVGIAVGMLALVLVVAVASTS